MNPHLIGQTLLYAVLICVLSCNNSDKLPSPKIQYGTAKISGQITAHNGKQNKATINIAVNNPITLNNALYKIMTDKDGNFSIDLDTEMDLSICGIYSDVNLFSCLFIIIDNTKETTFKIAYNENDQIEHAEIVNGIKLSENNILYAFDTMSEMIDYRSGKPHEQIYNKDTDYFLTYADNVLQERLNIAYNNSYLSESIKKIIAKDYTLLLYNTHVFDYKGEMIRNYRNTNEHKTPDDSEIQTPTREYYSFLKKLNLNDPQYLYCFSLSECIKQILQNDILNIPPISDTPIDTWLQQVKDILSDLVGFDGGLFYDLLVSNSYATQMNNAIRPLSEKQVKNIKDYYKGGEIEKILFRNNEKTVKKATEKGDVVANSTPDVPKEQLLYAIVDKYVGKVVVVDFWATWCGPCIEAIKESHELKKEMMDDVAFVYIAGPSSPEKLWEERINGIGGEHYYLTEDEYSYIMDSFGFNGIPSYLVFNNSGELKHKTTGYPGNAAMKELIGISMQ